METAGTQVTIRMAENGDAHWVVDLMDRTLTPYYDGDNRAHARRIIDAHLGGGHDKVGFFSYEQRMFIAEAGGERVGMIHLVGKRQGTYKISPLIVDERFRGIHGMGSTLLAHAEAYALRHGARQLYCTVAQGNKSALQFFLKKGFLRAGHSDSHYKADSTEVMLYMRLFTRDGLSQLDEVSISVTPFCEEKDAAQVRELILRRLPAHFDGIDESWVASLFSGYRRRHTGDVNTKFKLIFVAKSSDGTVLGIAGATPKKGTPVKLMPLIAETAQAFDALICDVPRLLLLYGRKVYVHVSPNVQEVITLQKHGWKLDAALPAAYKDDVITYQWSIDINEHTMRTMRVKRKFFDEIRSGRKQLEVRVAYDSIKAISAGERIRFVTHDDSCVVRVRGKRTYPSFRAMLAQEPFGGVVPGAASEDEVYRILKSFYDDAKEALGVVVLQMHVE